MGFGERVREALTVGTLIATLACRLAFAINCPLATAGSATT